MIELCNYRTRIEGDQVYLRTLESGDATEQYCAWLNDPAVNEYLETRQATIPELQAYITKRLQSSTAIFFGIFTKDTNKHIGNAKLEPIDWEKKTATMGILIGERAYWGKGIGTEVTKMLIDFTFSTLGLDEMNLGVIATNKAAIRVYEKCGMEVYELKKNHINHNGTLFDHVFMRIRK